jgi:hypothetical protein
LTPIKAIPAQNFFRILRVRGTGTHAVEDASGIPVNNGVDQVLSWKLHQGKTINYRDSQGDKVHLQLKGPGKLYVFERWSKDPDPVVFVDGVGASSSIAATVMHGKVAAVTDIAEVNGGQGIANGLLNNPSFQIASIVP